MEAAHAVECGGDFADWKRGFEAEAGQEGIGPKGQQALDGASIDYESNATGGQLNIRAPRIKGDMPGMEASLVERVRYVLDAEVNPRIAAHGGRISLLEVSAEGVVVLQFGGGCHGCGMVDVTLKQGVEKTLRERVPEITEVRDATDHAGGSNPYYSKREGQSALG